MALIALTCHGKAIFSGIRLFLLFNRQIICQTYLKDGHIVKVLLNIQKINAYDNLHFMFCLLHSKSTSSHCSFNS